MIKLAECEEQVLFVIWELEKTQGAFLAGIKKEANRRFNHDWKSQTVSTFLVRMLKKGYLSAEKKGRGNCYTSTFTLEQYQKERLQDMLENVFMGDADRMQECLKTVRNQKLTQEELS